MNFSKVNLDLDYGDKNVKVIVSWAQLSWQLYLLAYDKF